VTSVPKENNKNKLGVHSRFTGSTTGGIETASSIY